MIWACPVCLSLNGRQLLFKILEHLPYFMVYAVVFLHYLYESQYNDECMYVFMFNIPQTVMVIWRGDHSLKSHLTDW